MLVSIAICTWNRADSLDRTLRSMRSLNVADDFEIEILVVNNNSTDKTDEIILRHSSSIPIRRIFEPQQGLSHARNASIKGARGEIIAWTDDDVEVHSEWISEYVRASREWPEATFFGGTIEPAFDGTAPRWLNRHVKALAGPYGYCRYSDADRPFFYDEFPFAGNLAVRTSALGGHEFNPCVGRVGAQLMHGEETDFLLRLKGQGHLGIWVAGARIRHVIPADRQNRLYVLKWFVGYGRSVARLDAIRHHLELSGYSRREMIAHWSRRLRILMNIPKSSAIPAWLSFLRDSGYRAGLFLEALRLVDGTGVKCGMGRGQGLGAESAPLPAARC